MTPCTCGDLLKAECGRKGMKVHVMPAPSVIVVGEYRPFISPPCPHGVTWMAEPTGEQIAQWVRDGVE